MLLDQRIGKLGEIAVFNFLKDSYPCISYPDFNIYDVKNKSWKSDLQIPSCGYQIHVKSQNVLQSIKYGESWIFQYGDGKSKSYDKEIFDNKLSEDIFVAFVVVDLHYKTATVKAIPSLKFLHENKLFKKPVKNFNSTKLAVYYKDILTAVKAVN